MKKELSLKQVENLECWISEGLTLSQIAENFGMTPPTLSRIIKDDERAKTAYDNGRAVVVSQLEASLFKLAMGSTYTNTKERRVMNDDGSRTLYTDTEERELAPNLGALCYMLNNMAPERWQNVQNVNQNIREQRVTLDLSKIIKDS